RLGRCAAPRCSRRLLPARAAGHRHRSHVRAPRRVRRPVMADHRPSDARRRFLTGGAAGLAALWATETARSAAFGSDAGVPLDQPAPAGRLTPPARGPIPVAFVISNGAT